jgi:hypothetical protein
MKHVKAIAIKTVVIALLSWIVLSAFGEVPHAQSLITGVLISLVIYIVGDLLVLRKIGNVVATIADMGGAFLVAWLYLGAMVEGDFLMESLIVAVLVAVFEWFFHGWLLNNHVVPDERSMK